jgi:PAS domain S-box-containing protein
MPNRTKRELTEEIAALKGRIRELQEGSLSNAAEKAERIKRLAELSMMLTGEPLEVFEHIARIIGELLNVKTVCLSEIRNGELWFLSVYIDGKITSDAGHCPIKKTPCATIEKSKELLTYSNVAEKFPEAVFLKKHNAYSYCGLPSLDSEGNVVAVTCLLDPGPVDFTEEDKALLRIFAQRIGFEMERKRNHAAYNAAGEALKESLERYSTLVETAPHGIQENDIYGTITFSNRAHSKMLGCEEGGLVGRSIWDFLETEAEKERLRQNLEVLVREQPAPTPGFLRNRTRGGDFVDLRIDWNYKRDKQGELTGFVSIITDITAQKHVEEALRESEERLKAIIDNSTAVIYVKDLEGRYLLVNRWLETIFNIKSKDIKGRTDHDLFPKEIADAFRANDLSVLEAEAPMEFDEIATHPDGPRDYISIKFPLYNASGNIYAVCGISTDITERKRAEVALRSSEKSYRTLFEDSRDVVFVTTPEGKILEINEAGVKLFGYSSKEEFMALGSVSELYNDPGVRDLFRQTIERFGFVKNFSIIGKTKDGRRLDLLLTANAALDDEGRVTAYHGMIHDMTGHKSLEAQLMHSQKMEAVGTLAGGIAHDFNNIITVVKTLTDLALSKIDETDPCYKYFKPVNESALTALNLVQQLLLFGRNQPFEPESINLNDTAERLMGLIEHMISEDISVKTDFGRDLWNIKADEGRLEQVVINLMINSNEAMSQGGTISITTENATLDTEQCSSIHGAVPGRYVCLTVEDTGVGIDADVMARIFEPFFTTKTGKGTGMGLAVVYSIVTEHKGWINVTSTPDEGAVFKVWLPVTEADERTIAPAAARVHNAGEGKRILLVEDEKWVRKSTAMVLADNGYEVFEAADAEKALSLFYREKGRFDMVFSDVVMPGRSGLQLVSPLLDLNPNIPILLCSGYLDDKNQLSQIIKRGLAYIQKPFEIPELLQAVEETISEGRGHPRT